MDHSLSRHSLTTLICLALITSGAPSGGWALQQGNPLPGRNCQSRSCGSRRCTSARVGGSNRRRGPAANEWRSRFPFDVDNATATLSQGVLDYEVISRRVRRGRRRATNPAAPRQTSNARILLHSPRLQPPRGLDRLARPSGSGSEILTFRNSAVPRRRSKGDSRCIDHDYYQP